MPRPSEARGKGERVVHGRGDPEFRGGSSGERPLPSFIRTPLVWLILKLADWHARRNQPRIIEEWWPIMQTLMQTNDTAEVWKAVQREIPGLKADGIPGRKTALAVHKALVGRDWSPPQPEPVPAGEFDERTERHLATLLPKVQPKFRAFVRAAKDLARSSGFDYVVISGTRTFEEQNALYAQGRSKPGPIVTNARGGYSNHNFGIAIDGGIFKGGRYLDGSQDPTERKAAARMHAKIGQLAQLMGLAWGGLWSGFPDPPHVEWNHGVTISELRRRKLAGEDIV